MIHLLKLVSEAFESHRALESRVAGAAGLSGAEARILRTIGAGASVSQLARRLGLARQSVQRVADRLSERGLARFIPNPDHQRSPILLPTEAGSRARERVERELREWEAKLSELLEPEELETAELVLRGLKSALES
jgi:DNA-binding MarR family transcriptional regulator